MEALPVTHTYAHKRKLREEHLPPTGSCLLQHSCCECLLSANMEQVQSGGVVTGQEHRSRNKAKLIYGVLEERDV